ncbi:hypothetical protein CHUAL_006281 [Chamberlinius hualienensis]
MMALLSKKILKISLLWHISYCIKIVRQPSNISSVVSQTVQLDCIFDKEVNCVWLKNDNHLNIAERHQYKDRNGQATVDCSIVISCLAEYDSGVWQCANMADSNGNSIAKSTRIWLRIEDLRIIKHPQSLFNISNGNTAVLICLFNTKVNCTWMKDSNPVHGNRYAYLNELTNGKNTEDCSIKLLNTRKTLHEGNWICKNMVTDVLLKSVSSDVARLTIKDPTVVIDSDKIVDLSKKVELHCLFDISINCKWKLNETIVQIDGLSRRYKNNNGLSTQICSIVVDQVSYNDVGLWKCCCENNEDISSEELSVLINTNTTISHLISQEGKDVFKQSTVSTSSTGFIVTIVISIIINIVLSAYVVYKWKIKPKNGGNAIKSEVEDFSLDSVKLRTIIVEEYQDDEEQK